MNIEKLIELSEQGIRIGIYPVLNKLKHEWTVCIRVKDNKKLFWINGEKGCQNSSFSSFEEAYNNVINYCINNKEKLLVNEEKKPILL